MRDLALTIAAFRYDTTRALFDGTVDVGGLDGVERISTTMATAATVPEIFEDMIRHERFDVAELGLTFYLRMLDAGTPLVALPIFPNRVFRHSCVYVNVESGITGPRDLVDRTIGEFAIYGQDSGVWAKGVLMDEYGFRPERNRWVIGGLDRAAPPFDFVPRPHPDDVEVVDAPEGATLGTMLETGAIDALFSANVPQCVLDGSPHVRRLFPDFEPLERDYYRRTGIFPIMHAVVVRRDLLEGHPGLAQRIYRAFLAAKDIAAARYREGRRLYQVPSAMVPWLNALFEENRALLPDDWWPYGVSANRTAIDTYLRYHAEQGLSGHRRTVEEIFTPELLDT